jgi:hypothetical protein
MVVRIGQSFIVFPLHPGQICGEVKRRQVLDITCKHRDMRISLNNANNLHNPLIRFIK